MSWHWIVAALILLVFGLYLSSTAGRLDRLHHRIDTGIVALDAQLLRRSGTTAELASSGLLDPATSVVLAEAAAIAREAPGDPHERAQDESDLTKVLCAALPDPEVVTALADSSQWAAELIDALAGTVHRTAMSRTFYNDAVRATRAVRRQRLVRWFRLAGHTDWPETVEMDDTVPVGLEGR